MAKWLAAAALLGVSVVAQDCLAAPPLSPQMFGLYQRAEAAYEAGRYRDAMRDFERVAIDGGNDVAAFRMGWMYHKGLGIPVDFGEAARWYTFAANAGETAAMNNLSVLYENGGPNLAANAVAANQWLTRAAQAGSAVAQANLAQELSQRPDAEKWQYEIYDLARRSAQQNAARGHQMLANCYANGFGAPKALTKAVEHYEHCANLAVAETDLDAGQVCANELSIAYGQGIGVVPNARSAYAWGLATIAGPQVVDEELRKQLVEPSHALPPASASDVQQKVSVWQATKDANARARIMASIRLAPEAPAQGAKKPGK